PEPHAPTAPEPAAPPAPAADPTPAGLGLDGVKALWPTVVETVGVGNGMLAAALAESHPVAVGEEEIVVAFAPDQAFHKRLAEREGNRIETAEGLRTVLGRPFRLVYEVREDLAPAAEHPTLEGDELVRRFVAEFDAEEIVEEEAEKT
ncbi:MAG: polymerase subunit gamma and tau, partial [Solirubrobacterales bacterium]|nr:polymerase subunit gamma and tau [Solirubrobacterales bacterium]